MKAYLIRHQYRDEETLGSLHFYEGLNEIFSCRTLELPWRNNLQSESCIPEDTYTVRKRSAEESGGNDYDHLIIEDVPSRSYILLEIGNYYSQTKGCIFPGKHFTDINGDGLLDVAYSGDTLKKILGNCPESFTIKVLS